MLSSAKIGFQIRPPCGLGMENTVPLVLAGKALIRQIVAFPARILCVLGLFFDGSASAFQRFYIDSTLILHWFYIDSTLILHHLNVSHHLHVLNFLPGFRTVGTPSLQAWIWMSCHLPWQRSSSLAAWYCQGLQSKRFQEKEGEASENYWTLIYLSYIYFNKFTEEFLSFAKLTLWGCYVLANTARNSGQMAPLRKIFSQRSWSTMMGTRTTVSLPHFGQNTYQIYHNQDTNEQSKNIKETKIITHEQTWSKMCVSYCQPLQPLHFVMRGQSNVLPTYETPPWWSRCGSGNMPGGNLHGSKHKERSKERETKETWGIQCIMDPQVLSTK